MTDYPIIFSAPMVRALIEGRKTQTRRLRYVKRGPGQQESAWTRVRIGDRAWVRETWARGPSDGAPLWRASTWGREPFRSADKPIKWRSPIYMPRCASRITLAVTEIRRQRVQEISEEDAVAEGVYRHQSWGGAEWWQVDDLYVPAYASSKASHVFSFLWASLHGSESWHSNPEIIAFTFTVMPCNIDTATP